MHVITIAEQGKLLKSYLYVVTKQKLGVAINVSFDVRPENESEFEFYPKMTSLNR